MPLNTISRLFWIVILIITMSGCAGHKHKPKQQKHQESFTTHIEDSGIKKFSYQITMAERNRPSKQGGKGRGRDRPQGPPPGDDQSSRHQDERVKDLIDQGLGKILQTSRYCVEGYDVVDEEIRERTAIVRGQCIERASEEDRATFPNTVETPLVIEEDLGAI